MFIIDLTYTAPLTEVDALLEAHVAYLKEQYARGVFLASGRKSPRTGGIILARCASPEELWRVLDQDPFRRGGVADYAVTEFTASMTAAGLEGLKE